MNALGETVPRVAAHMGEPDRAIGTIQKLLTIPYEGPLGGGQAPLTTALLRLDPMFDPLTQRSTFTKLIAEPAVK